MTTDCVVEVFFILLAPSIILYIGTVKITELWIFNELVQPANTCMEGNGMSSLNQSKPYATLSCQENQYKLKHICLKE